MLITSMPVKKVVLDEAGAANFRSEVSGGVRGRADPQRPSMSQFLNVAPVKANWYYTRSSAPTTT